jgi:hypothetical protein
VRLVAKAKAGIIQAKIQGAGRECKTQNAPPTLKFVKMLFKTKFIKIRVV